MGVRILLLKQNGIGKVCVSKHAEKSELNFKKDIRRIASRADFHSKEAGTKAGDGMSRLR